MAPSNMGDALCKPANSSLRRAARDALLTALDSVCASRVLRKSYCEAIGEIAVIVPGSGFKCLKNFYFLISIFYL